jgi:hypothetical protein
MAQGARGNHRVSLTSTKGPQYYRITMKVEPKVALPLGWSDVRAWFVCPTLLGTIGVVRAVESLANHALLRQIVAKSILLRKEPTQAPGL